ncbi:hypothetical protein BHE74_00048480 [Ensete ventricosum]|nr:hypothetical protein BHE74_00048480 [Ensete ventricosum]RZS07599.1 hypothetical protein BHM03_00038462 [Ensete ventricosum]
MHPLRFPNRGIRAKVIVRKIGLKLRVMRLNRIESFYAFLLHFRYEGSPCKGQPGMAMASPLAGAAGYGKAPCKGGLLPTVCRRSPAANPQGVTDCGFGTHRKVACGHRHRPQGLPPARAAANNGNACRGGARGGADCRGGRPLAKWLPAGKGSRRLRRGSSGGGGAVKVKEG